MKLYLLFFLQPAQFLVLLNLLKCSDLVFQLHCLLLVLCVVESKRILSLHQRKRFFHLNNLSFDAFSSTFGQEFLVHFVSVFHFFFEYPFEDVLPRPTKGDSLLSVFFEDLLSAVVDALDRRVLPVVFHRGVEYFFGNRLKVEFFVEF